MGMVKTHQRPRCTLQQHGTETGDPDDLSSSSCPHLASSLRLYEASLGVIVSRKSVTTVIPLADTRSDEPDPNEPAPFPARLSRSPLPVCGSRPKAVTKGTVSEP